MMLRAITLGAVAAFGAPTIEDLEAGRAELRSSADALAAEPGETGELAAALRRLDALAPAMADSTEAQMERAEALMRVSLAWSNAGMHEEAQIWMRRAILLERGPSRRLEELAASVGSRSLLVYGLVTKAMEAEGGAPLRVDCRRRGCETFVNGREWLHSETLPLGRHHVYVVERSGETWQEYVDLRAPGEPVVVNWEPEGPELDGGPRPGAARARPALIGGGLTMAVGVGLIVGGAVALSMDGMTREGTTRDGREYVDTLDSTPLGAGLLAAGGSAVLAGTVALGVGIHRQRDGGSVSLAVRF